jgi:hypothetical protein
MVSVSLSSRGPLRMCVVATQRTRGAKFRCRLMSRRSFEHWQIASRDRRASGRWRRDTDTCSPVWHSSASRSGRSRTTAPVDLEIEPGGPVHHVAARRRVHIRCPGRQRWSQEPASAVQRRQVLTGRWEHVTVNRGPGLDNPQVLDHRGARHPHVWAAARSSPPGRPPRRSPRRCWCPRWPPTRYRCLTRCPCPSGTGETPLPSNAATSTLIAAR